MNLEPIRALLELAEKATPGPWRTDDYHAYVWGRDIEMVADTHEDNGSIVRMRGVGANLPIEDNLAFILAARNSVPALSELLEAVTWIKCSERMPPQGVDVWVYWPRSPEQDGFPELKEWVARASWIRQRDRLGGWNWADHDYSGTQLPTHWMPLPSPPEDK